MNVIYATEEPSQTLLKSIFLAGPSPRDPLHPNWREEALELLEDSGFDGTVFVPLPRLGKWEHDYDEQVEWETTYLNMADVILFWVPRDLTVVEDVPKGESAEKALKAPAFTTNVEFGAWVTSGKVVLGYPDSASKVRYLAHHAEQEGVPTFQGLKKALEHVVERLGDGAERTGGEREVPLHIWNLNHFQGWYKAQKGAGNRLDGARLLWSFRVGPKKDFTFAFVLHANVYIASEGRNKVNEFVFTRTDIATIVAYSRPTIDTNEIVHHFQYPEAIQHEMERQMDRMRRLKDTEVAIIREFRSPARTKDGFIREIPGGSSWKEGEDPFVTMTHELEEETGLGEKSGFAIDPSRLRKVGSRQLCGTLSSHQAHVFACELSEDEMEYLKRQQAEGVAHGVEEDSERTYVEIHKVGDLLQSESDLLDWSVLGMILTALV